MKTARYARTLIADRVESWLKAGGELNLADCHVSADDLEQLASNEQVTRSVHTLRLTGNDADAWLRAMPLLGRLPELHRLQVNGCGLGDVEDVEDLFADGLAACRSLNCLGLGFNGLTAEMLTPAFACKSDLEILDLSGNRLDDTYALSVALRPLTKLLQLNLGSTDLADGEGLFQALEGLRHLTHLSLCECVYLDDLTHLAALLPINGGSLQAVDVRGCELWEQRVAEDPALSERNGLNATVAMLRAISVEWERSHAAPLLGSRR
jgi:hypothetical protein